MKALKWIIWILAVCMSLTEARYKIRRPLPPAPPPPPHLYKKSWPIGHRMSMGNTIHINNNVPPKRPIFGKPNNFRGRPGRPVFNGPPNVWKNQIPILSAVQNVAVLPQRPPVKEFHMMNKVPEYSPEYRPEPMALPPTHRGGIDDDKGPIHTIPAPNLSLADKPYNPTDGNGHDNRPEDHRRYPNDAEYTPNVQVTNYGYGTLMTSASPQRPVTSPTPTQNAYQVTETNEINLKDYQTVTPTFFPPDFDPSRFSTGSSDVQSNELYLNHPPISRAGIVGTNIQFGQSNVPMQTNLHSSLHVGFPSSGQGQPDNLHIGQQSNQDIHIGQQPPDLHVGHPAPAGPPLSATQLYDLLNSFPQQLGEQYGIVQQPQLNQHLLQQQLGQIFQPGVNPTTFSQPQMHSFNYDEQANKRQQQQQQQQVLVEQDYASGSVTAGYNLEPEQPLDVRSNGNINQELPYHQESSEQADNNIDYEAAASAAINEAAKNNYFDTINNGGNVPSQFYTTLPNREAAEKLAALAAAGNVNSQLIGKLRKHQQRQENEEVQGDAPMPNNHRIKYEVREDIDDSPPDDAQRNGYSFLSPLHKSYYRRQQSKQEQSDAIDDLSTEDTQREKHTSDTFSTGSSAGESLVRQEQSENIDNYPTAFTQREKDTSDVFPTASSAHTSSARERPAKQEQSEKTEDLPTVSTQRGKHSSVIRMPYNRLRIRQQQIRQEQEKADKHYEQQRFQKRNEEELEEEEEKPLRIMVPEVEEKNPQNNFSSEKSSEDYDYDVNESDYSKSSTFDEQSDENSGSEFGTRISGKTGK